MEEFNNLVSSRKFSGIGWEYFLVGLDVEFKLLTLSVFSLEAEYYLRRWELAVDLISVIYFSFFSDPALLFFPSSGVAFWWIIEEILFGRLFFLFESVKWFLKISLSSKGFNKYY